LQPGLADLLTEDATTQNFHLCQTKVSGLSLIPAGMTSKNPADLLGSERFSNLIDDLRKHFDWIVLDSSPVLPVTDPCLGARVASGVLMVVNASHTARQAVTDAVERLETAGATLVGAMLNRVVINRAESYFTYYRQDYKNLRVQPTGNSRA